MKYFKICANLPQNYNFKNQPFLSVRGEALDSGELFRNVDEKSMKNASFRKFAQENLLNPRVDLRKNRLMLHEFLKVFYKFKLNYDNF